MVLLPEAKYADGGLCFGAFGLLAVRWTNLHPFSCSSPFLLLKVSSLSNVTLPSIWDSEDEANRSLLFWFADAISSGDLLLISATHKSAFAPVLFIEIPNIKHLNLIKSLKVIGYVNLD